MFAAIFKKDFVGENVPRDKNGQWTKLRFEHGKGFVGHDKPLNSKQQEQLKKLGPIPPAWSEVHLNPDPKGATQVKGRDAKGKQQIKQHPEAIAANAAAKWERVSDFHNSAFKPITDAALKTMKDKNATPRERDLGAVIHLVSKTGFRIGGSDTGAQDQAYGASTLEKKHIKVTGDKIDFNFVGKSGVTQQKTIHDPELAAYLSKKLPSLKANQQVFAASDADARAFIKKAAGNDKFKPKDFRTWHGTGLALSLRKAMKPPTTEKEYKDQQKLIADAVSNHLGNTPTVALASYIAPVVWSKWNPDLAPKPKTKKEEGFAHIFSVRKDEMVSFEVIWAAMEEAVNDDSEKDPEDGSPPFEFGAVAKATSKKPLYVCRPVLNAKDIVAWAKKQGFATTLVPEDIHATIVYSKTPMDWDAAGDSVDKLTVKGGVRGVKPLGSEGAVVLTFTSAALQVRWQAFRDAGASWDYEGYQPHLSISYDAADVDLDKVEPYQGPIVFGPEVFEEISKPKIVEKDDMEVADLAVAGFKTVLGPKKLKKFNPYSIALKDSAASVKAWLSRARATDLTPENTQDILKMAKKQKADDIASFGQRGADAHDLFEFMAEHSAMGTEGTNYTIKARTGGGRLLSAIEYTKDESELHIEFLSSFHAGEGTHWLQHVEKEAAAEGLKVTLNATPAARAFYKKLGYKARSKAGEQTVMVKTFVMKDTGPHADIGALCAPDGYRGKPSSWFSQVFKDSAASFKAWLSREHSKFKGYDEKSKALIHNDLLGQTYYKLRAKHGKEAPETQAAYAEWKKSKVHLVANHGMSQKEVSDLSWQTEKKFNASNTPAPVQSTAPAPAPAVALTAGQKAALTKKLNQQAAAAQAAMKQQVWKQNTLNDLKAFTASDGDMTQVHDFIAEAKKAGASSFEIDTAMTAGQEAANAKKLAQAKPADKKFVQQGMSVKDHLKAAHMEVAQALELHGKKSAEYEQAVEQLQKAVQTATAYGLTSGQQTALKAVSTAAYKAHKAGLGAGASKKDPGPAAPKHDNPFPWANEHSATYTKLKEKAKQVLPSLTPAQTWAIKEYTGSGYSTANKKQAQANGAHEDEYAKNLSSALNNEIGVAIKLRRNMAQQRMWAALGLDISKMNDYSDDVLAAQIGKTYREPVFSSTTHNKHMELALTSTGALTGLMELNINAPPHTKGVFIEHLSSHKHEAEVLLQRGATYIIRKIERHPKDNGNAGAFKYRVEVDWIGVSP